MVGNPIEDQNNKELSGQSVNANDKYIQRSKTAVNIMKLNILASRPELSVIIDSNEAHIRLMSGTWSAINFTSTLVFIGSLISLFFSLVTIFREKLIMIPEISGLISMTNSFYEVLFAITLSLYFIMKWSKNKIEFLFHYRCVSELFYIVQSAYLADQPKKINENDNKNTILELLGTANLQK